MMALWQTLNWPQALLLAAVSVAFLVGPLPVLIRRSHMLARDLAIVILSLLAAVSPAAERRIRELMARLRKQRLQLQKMHRRAKRHPAREGAAA